MRYPRIELGPHRWQRRILTTELIALYMIIIEYHIRAPRIELGTSCVWSRRHNQLDQARLIGYDYMIDMIIQQKRVSSQCSIPDLNRGCLGHNEES